MSVTLEQLLHRGAVHLARTELRQRRRHFELFGDLPVGDAAGVFRIRQRVQDIRY